MSDTEQVEAGPEQKRIYIGGLHDTITEESVRDRFQKFGTVSAVSIARDTEGKCRGFGHMSITTTPKDWSSCIASYNGAKWKGQTLRLEEAKEDYLEKKRKEQVKLIEREEKKRKRLARWNDSDGFMARDMTPVTDSNMKDRKGWKRGRYGRAIAVMRLRKDNGTTFVFEPTHYKNNLTKLYNIGGRMKTLRELPTRYEDYEDEDDHFDAQLAQNVSDEEMEDIESEGEGEGEAMTVEDKLVAKHEKDNAKRLAALERREEEQKARNEIMKRSFADMEEAKRTQHVSFESDGEENVPVAAKVVAEKPEAKDSKWMFDSDEDEDEEMEININPVLEGANGEQRLALQSKFKGDERFKLGEDFIDDGEADADGEEGDVITKELTEEKGQALDILKAMFGEQGVVKQKQVSQWSNSARFDPDAENAEDYIVKPKIEDKEDIGGQDENDDEDSSDQAQEDDKDYVRRPQSAMPVVSKEKHFEVNVNLKPLFSTQDEPFKMFGQESEGEEDEEEEEERELDESHLVLKNKEAPVGLGLFFFFHMDDPGLLKKSCLTYDTHGLFQQQEDRKAHLIKWRTARSEVGQVLKKRQKEAVKKQKKQVSQGIK